MVQVVLGRHLRLSSQESKEFLVLRVGVSLHLEPPESELPFYDSRSGESKMCARSQFEFYFSLRDLTKSVTYGIRAFIPINANTAP